ncbi:MAG TPA: FAD-binding oxidoreductase [Candidatus Dormibacteraeota bacterium]|jgi:alkyldihydroxyacetonephosphate synthase|nr:FAD-binding oxidoreductase [Candidatus Dormibacteraeota bacterium]
MSERRAVHDAWPEGTMRRRAGQAAPEVEVVRPRSVDEVRDALRSGRRVVPLGGGSGVCGAVAPEPDDLVLDLGDLREIEIDEVDLVCRAQAGVLGLELERRLQERGLTLGHFPSSLPVATVGGMVSTRSCGQESTRHGAIEDLVMGLEVVLPDGTLLEAAAQPRSGLPALHQLFVGAEGGLGVIVSAALRVRRLPERVLGRGWRLPDVHRGLEAMRELTQRDLRPLVLRLYDPEDALFQGQSEGCLLIVAAAGCAGVAEAEAAVIGRTLSGLGAEDLGEEPWNRWLARRFDLSLERLQQMLEPQGSFVDTIEVAARWSALEETYRAIKAHLSGVGLALCHFGHPYGQGACAYFTLAGSADDDEAALAAHSRAWEGTMAIALERGAAISHHHGVGRARARWVEAGLGGWADVWRLVRGALDPEGRMNPGALGGLR